MVCNILKIMFEKMDLDGTQEKRLKKQKKDRK